MYYIIYNEIVYNMLVIFIYRGREKIEDGSALEIFIYTIKLASSVIKHTPEVILYLY
jgi:hypothetical protein